MRIPHEFDAFYEETRDEVLLETLAATGDVTTARGAVRDAYASAWHHWRKVSRIEDKMAWIRPQALRLAQRRASTRLGGRDVSATPPNQADLTLAALRSLPRTQRRALVLSQLSTLPLAAIVREVGLPEEKLLGELATATRSYTAARGIEEGEIGRSLEALRPLAAATRWPTEQVVRASGATRRRITTVVGVLAAGLALIFAGQVVTEGDPANASLTVGDPLEHRATRLTPKPTKPELVEDSLLSADQVSRIAPRLTWTETSTSANTSGDGLVLPCQLQRYADPAGLNAYFRTFSGVDTTAATAKGRNKKSAKKAGKTSGKQPKQPKQSKQSAKQQPVAPTSSIWQVAELSPSADQAAQAYQTNRSWYAGCTAPRQQLLAAYELAGVGDEASAFTLRDWSGSDRTVTVAVAVTGDLTLTVASELNGSLNGPLGAGSSALRSTSSALAAAVNKLCGQPGSGACAGPPRIRRVTVPGAGQVPGMLSEFDLPPVSNAVGPWVGTPVESSSSTAVNLTPCDRVNLWGKGFRESLSRTFVFPETKGHLEFGITQNVGMMGRARAEQFIDDQRKRITNCADAAYGLKTTRLRQSSTKTTDVTTWQMEVELTDNRTVRMLTAIARRNGNVTQLVYVPSKSMSLSQAAFDAVVDRAVERLHRLDLTTLPR